jgi:hypothetical protein
VRPLLVGQAPGPRTGGRAAFDGDSGRRLSRVVGADVLALVDAVNLLDSYPGSAGKGDRFPIREAPRAAAGLDLSGRPLALLAGLGVARAFGLRVSLLEWTQVRGTPALVVPHPSGVSRWWNSRANAERARAALRAALLGTSRTLTAGAPSTPPTG